MYKFHFFLYLIYCTFSLRAQDPCSRKIKLAEELLTQGRPDEIPALLNDCVGKDQDRELRVAAYRLLTIAYLMEDDRRYESAFHSLLKLYPRFSIDTTLSTDPAELLHLYHSYKTDPYVHVSLSLGYNRGYREILQSRSIGNIYNSEAQYSQNTGAQINFQVSKALVNRNLRLSLGVNYFDGYDLDYEGKLSTINSNLDFAVINFTEELTMFQFPLSIQYDFDYLSPYNFIHRKTYFFAYGGARLDYLTNANIFGIQRINTNSPSKNGLENDDVSSLRQKINIALLAGVGLKFRMGGSFFFVRGTYSVWLRNMNQDAYANSELTYILGYIDPDVRLHHLAVDVGVERPLFRHIKRKTTY